MTVEVDHDVEKNLMSSYLGRDVGTSVGSPSKSRGTPLSVTRPQSATSTVKRASRFDTFKAEKSKSPKKLIDDGTDAIMKVNPLTLLFLSLECWTPAVDRLNPKPALLYNPKPYYGNPTMVMPLTLLPFLKTG